MKAVFRVTAATAMAVLILGALSEPAGAHPLGNFTINHYAGLVLGPDRVGIDYVLDLAEIPTFQERSVNEAPPRARCEELASALQVEVDGQELDLVVGGASVEFLPGQGGLETTRIECALEAAFAPAPGVRHLAFRDGNYEARLGWREITVRGDATSVRTELPSESISARLTAYPEGAPQPDAAEATVRFSATGGASDVGTPPGEAAPSGPAGDRAEDSFIGLIARGENGLMALLAAMGIAAALGAVHGLAPGHGKTVIAAYLVATRGTRRQAFFLAVAVALSHTLGVFVLGGATVAASSAFAPERVYPYLQAVSAAIVVGLGMVLVAAWMRARRRAAAAAWLAPASDLAHHDHGHDHDHDHGHDHGHDHDHQHGHGHGLLPHRHSRRLRELDPADGPLGWRALALLGLSGGLVPSTSAVVLLLGAIQLERLFLGGVLILAFGVGMSIALVSVGVGIVIVSRRANRFIDASAIADRLTRLVQPVAGFAVLGVGLYLASRAITSIGAVT